MYKIGAVGDRDSILGFRAIGVDVRPVHDKESIAAALKEMVKDGYGIIFVTEQAIIEVPEDIKKYRTLGVPAIVPIPGNKGSEGLGMNWVKESVIKAIGADILQ